MNRFWHLARSLLSLFLFGVALWIARDVLREYSFHQVVRELGAIPLTRLAAALGLTAFGYLALVGYDFVALRFIGRPLGIRAVLPVSFVSYAVQNSAPVAILTGGGLRYRLYSRWGLTALETAEVAAIDTATYVLGLFTIGGLVFLLEPLALPRTLRLPLTSMHPVGIAFLGVVAAYLVVAAVRRRPIRLRGLEVHAPTPRLAAEQIGVSCCDWLLSGAVLWVVLPAEAAVSYPVFLGIFLLAQIAALISPLPGGLGVFEAVILALVPHGGNPAGLLSSLVVYRIVYYLIPLLLAIIEAAHVLGGVAGVLLLFLAWGLGRRLRSAYRLTLALLVAAILFSLLRGLAYVQAGFFAVLLLLLAPAHRVFYRTGAFREARFGAGWTTAVVITLLATVWLGVFAYPEVEQPWEHIGRFVLSPEAGQFVRTLVAIAATVAVVMLIRLVRRPPPRPALPGPAALDRAESVVDRSPRAGARLALLGDKALLFTDDDVAFLMHASTGRSMVALGDPVGPGAARTELAWRFRELADRIGAWAVVYDVAGDRAGPYVDLGLQLEPVGEAARVRLDRPATAVEAMARLLDRPEDSPACSSSPRSSPGRRWRWFGGVGN